MKKLFTVLTSLFLSSFLLFGQSDAQLSTQDKLYGLGTFWKGVDKHFAFFDQVPNLDWDSMYYANIPLVMATENDYDYVRLLQRMCHELQDGHTRVYLPNYLPHQRSRPAIYTDIIDNKVFVTHILNDTIAAMGVTPRMEIIAIDGVPVLEYADREVRPYVFASTPQDEDVQVFAYHLLRGQADVPVKLKLQDTDGNITEKSLPRNLVRNHPPQQTMTLDILEGNIGHLTITNFWRDDFVPTFDSLFPLIQKTDGLVIDIRKNQGGSSDNSVYVMQHLSDQPFHTSNWSTPTYNAAFASWEMEQVWFSEPGITVTPVDSIQPYDKPVTLLIGVRTYSAAEDFCSYFREAKVGPMIGSLTGGSTGNPIGINLVGEVWAQVCTKRDVFYDGTEFVGYGVRPDIEVVQHIDDYFNQIDIVLAEAIEHIKKQ